MPSLEHLFTSARHPDAMSAALSLVSALRMHDDYTATHSVRVGHLASRIAAAMGLGDDRAEGLLVCGALHDLGKISVSRATLNTTEQLSDDEWAEIRGHASEGAYAARHYPWPWPVTSAIVQHHERLDGSGYPLGLEGSEIILEARILAVADAYDAMSKARPYRQALGREYALDSLEACAGHCYDAACVAVLRDLVMADPTT